MNHSEPVDVTEVTDPNRRVRRSEAAGEKRYGRKRKGRHDLPAFVHHDASADPIFRTMDRIIFLDLYGEIDHTRADDLAWQLYQSRPVSRLRDISLSSVPSSFVPHGTALSRFQHSVAVGYLARGLCSREKTLRPWRNTLVAAGICHDLGSPPFSHIAEVFLHDLTGRTHARQTEEVLKSGSEIDLLLARYNVDSSTVTRLINGDPQEPFSPLIAGSIDLDNISNSQDLLRSLGYRDEIFYQPLRLVQAFKLEGNDILLDSEYLPEMVGWAASRRKLYDILYSEPHLSAASMLYRALEFAYVAGALQEDFFTLPEGEALYFLTHKACKEASRLLDRLHLWRHYPRLYEQINPQEDMRIASLYNDWVAKRQFADRLADEFGVFTEEVAVYAGRDHGEKAIHLRFTGPKVRQASKLCVNGQGIQRLSIFAPREVLERIAPEKIEQIVKEAIDDLPLGTDEKHVFF